MSSPDASLTGNRRPIPILVYHQIAPAPPKGSAFRSLCVAPAAFARQMAALRWLGYTGLSMGALMPYLRGERQGRVVGITFDDGYLNNLTHALPVLRRHGFSSTCYAVSERLGQSNVWDAPLGVAQVPLMDASQLRQWVDGGQELGAHTRHHANLLQTPDELAWDEIAGSRDSLQALAGSAVAHFCYPYGLYDERHQRMAAQAGFQTSTTTRRGRVHPGADWQALPRVPVLRSTSLALLAIKLLSAYEDGRA